MRHEYVGDEGDYAKVALLTALSRGKQLGVNWYLTVHEEPLKDDGDLRDHLHAEDEWAHLDATLLRRMVETLRDLDKDDRHIELLEPLLPGAIFFDEGLPTGDIPLGERLTARKAWSARALAHLAGTDLVFLDPDNGFEVPSLGERERTRCKFANYAEAAAYLARDQAVVAYQHRPRETWTSLVAKKKAQMVQHRVPTAPPGFIAFGSRGFFLMHRDPAEVAGLTRRAQAVKEACDEEGWTKLKIDVIPPEPHAR